MTDVGFIVLFGLSFVFIPCQGQITSPQDGTKLTFLKGSNVNITWSFIDRIAYVNARVWYFTRSDGSFNTKRLVRIFGNRKPQIFESGLSGVEIVKPATLILKNVDQTYDGTYRFDISSNNGAVSSKVVVFIAKKPNVTFSCSRRVTVNEGNDSTCVCRGEGGNPPASITWYKDGSKIGETRKEYQILTLRNVNETDRGNYTCEARSHINDEFVDKKSIEVQVYFKAKNTKITFTPKRAVVNKSVTIMCTSRGLPEPSYSIVHSGNEVSTNKTYTIDDVQYSDAGTYKCIAWNKLGNDSASADLTVIEKPIANIDCPSLVTVNEGYGHICVCTSESGIPPANLTWYKNGIKFVNGNRLILINVNKQDSGAYSCKAQRYNLMDEKSIEIRVNLKPRNASIKIGFHGNGGTITCNSEGYPEPSYNITHDNRLLSTSKTKQISVDDLEARGTYTCIAINIFGSDSASREFKVDDKQGNRELKNVAVYLVVISLASFIIGVFLAYIAWCSHRRCFKNRKPERNLEQQPTEAESIYQELDLSKMNRENNYQSLRGNAASNDDESAYTELSKTRDEENNYQSLI